MTESKLLFDKTIKCPGCLKEFTTKKVRTSRLRLLKRDEDFLNYYNDVNPISYAIFVCPNCGYASSESKFENISKEGINIIKSKISSKWVKREFGEVRNTENAIETYKLALLQGTMLGYTNLELGNICLNLGWLFRIKEDEDEEIRFLRLARDKFIEAYNNESLSGSNMDDAKITYLIAELSRRINEEEESLTWFAICLALPGIKMNPALDNMAREQWRLTKDTVKA